MKSKIVKLELNEVNRLANFFNLIAQTKGHNLAFSIARNKFNLSEVLTVAEKQIDEFKKPFFREENKAIYDKEGNYLKDFTPETDIKPNHVVGFKLNGEEQTQLNELLTKIKTEVFEVELKTIDNKHFEKACGEGIFDGIDISDYFLFTEKLK